MLFVDVAYDTNEHLTQYKVILHNPSTVIFSCWSFRSLIVFKEYHILYILFYICDTKQKKTISCMQCFYIYYIRTNVLLICNEKKHIYSVAICHNKKMKASFIKY